MLAPTVVADEDPGRKPQAFGQQFGHFKPLQGGQGFAGRQTDPNVAGGIAVVGSQAPKRLEVFDGVFDVASHQGAAQKMPAGFRVWASAEEDVSNQPREARPFDDAGDHAPTSRI